MVNEIKNLFCCCCIVLQQKKKRKKKKRNLTPSIRSLPLGSNGKDSFGVEAEAWVGGAERQTSATADKHGSVSEGEGVGGDEGREGGDKGVGEGVKQEMRHWGVLPNSAAATQRRHGGTEAQSFSSFKQLCDKTSLKTFLTCTHFCFISLT